MSPRRAVSVLLTALLVSSLAAAPAAAAPEHGDHLRALHSLRGPVTDENFYFVMADRFDNGDPGNDRGGLPDDRLISGFDPTSRGFYNGGDLKGLLNRIDYIRGLGTTSIWLTPSFKNKAVQLEDGPSAGYHGYWITDFTQIDPHLGTNADLRALVDAAHRRGMKVYFDIITNHTADVIGYQQGARRPYVGKDAAPYRTAAGAPFDDRDHAGTNGFPSLSAATSFPYTPVLDPGETNLKVPAWLNDVTLYHNRGDTTFVGENSLYGDFFGLDDLFTEHPRVVQGMIEIYQRWIADFGVDGFRIDTMKHVNDEFWQEFGPRILQFAREHGKREFFMFGEVFDTTKSFTSQFTTRDRMQSVLDFPFQAAARDFASRGAPTSALEAFFAGDDWYTDADSNAYQLPTFLGNHDMGRFGGFVQADNPGAGDAEWLGRDRLAHELMYLSRGNPVIYYGDEQGFTGNGGDQLARQTMFASQVPDYLDDDLLGTDATHAQANFEPGHPLYRSIRTLADLARAHPALRDGTHQHRLSSAEAGIYAFSRLDRARQREYVVALNNSEQPKTAAIPTYAGNRTFHRIYGSGPDRARSAGDRALTLTVPPLSTVVYLLDGEIPGSRSAPAISLGVPEPAAESRARLQVSASVSGSSFYEVTFYARTAGGSWTPIGTDDTAPYRVFHDVSSLRPGAGVQYRAVVQDNRGHTSRSAPRSTAVPSAALTIESPAENSGVRGTVEVRAVADPDRASHVVRFERSVADGPWTPIGSDDSSPAYTVFDDLTPLNLAAGTPVRYRAKLTEAGRTTTSAPRTVRAAGPPATLATLHYFRPAGDYTDWGLHMWGDAVHPDVLAQIAWDRPWPPTRIENGWAVYNIPLISDTAPVNFIMHLPAGDTVPTTREPGGDRSFLPINTPNIWIKQGDPTIYPTQPPTP
ncbi:MAG TPA: alpha-amylase family glycosyl hydrolase [Actinophytocola sp.]|uniref:alpha-amylase family glycosyl hydrolase n=1 Tax=Actinophytocola sp. TaxID=1872138 RepID=UPI002DBDAC1C|nr:alpha-amylase family glycosyl hydrolase [Actinophytocola sp.]HEU5471751.1 alpha-amylase family glycosyl hydrolase [Actinophytocola sp.]